MPIKLRIFSKDLTGFATYDAQWTNWDDTHLVTAAEIKSAIQAGTGTPSSVILTTTVENYEENQIGCFCQTTGILLNPDSPVVKVFKWNSTFGAATAKLIVGIIQGPNSVLTHGPVFCRQSGPSIAFEVGDFLVPSEDLNGCKPATNQEPTTIISSGMPRVRIMHGQLENGMFACFIN
jgi:hypothetical protein